MLESTSLVQPHRAVSMAVDLITDCVYRMHCVGFESGVTVLIWLCLNLWTLAFFKAYWGYIAKCQKSHPSIICITLICSVTFFNDIHVSWNGCVDTENKISVVARWNDSQKNDLDGQKCLVWNHFLVTTHNLKTHFVSFSFRDQTNSNSIYTVTC